MNRQVGYDVFARGMARGVARGMARGMAWSALTGAGMLCAAGFYAAGPVMAEAGGASAVCHGPFPAPHGPMDLSRRVQRSLADGKALIVTRHYRVTFRVHAPGFVIEGQWRGTDVEAPPRLAAMAQMEKTRADNATFPMQLDREGMILSGGPGDRAVLSDDETSAARRLIAGADLDQPAREQASQFLEQLTQQQGSMINQWPVALFRPGTIDSQTRQELTLPQGQSGQAIITVVARSAQPCAVMQQMERKVQTMIAGEMRETREIWAMTPARD